MQGGERVGAGRKQKEPTRPIYMRVPVKHYDAIRAKLEEIVKSYT